jgi:signal transduction histidine kinase
MRWSIRSQLLVPLFMLLLGAAGISAWTAHASAQHAREQIEARVRQVARNLSEETSYPLAENVLAQMKRLSGADYVLVPREGEPLTTLESLPEDLPAASAVGDDWQKLELGPPLSVGENRYLCSGIRLTRPPRSGGTLYILYPESLLRDAQWQAVWPVLTLGGFVGVAAAVLALGVGQRLSRRVRDLERRTRLIADGDFSPMPVPHRHDEIRDLARSVNEMAQKLAQFQETALRIERLRLLGQVSAGLAHQLRNGLTGARLAVQLFLRENEDAADAESLRVALRQLTLLESNLKRFLDLGHEGDRQRVPCSLTELVTEAVELLRSRCRHAGISLCWTPPEDRHTTVGDPGQLGQMILNVLTNAVEAAGPSGKVEVVLERDPEAPGNARLDVIDSGPGPSPAVAARLFEPFVTGKPEGVGLGLAVSRQVAEAHGGSIHWQREADRTRFRILLPVEKTDLTPASSGAIQVRQP